MRFAVVGAGTIGQLRAQTIRANPATELAGVLDVAQANAAKAAAGTGARVCQSLEQLLELPGLEAVIVSSPLQFHEQAVVAALRAGKHVLCEKPLGNTVDSCRRMLDAASASGKRLATGFNHRYYPSIKFLKQAIDEGRIGTLDMLVLAPMLVGAWLALRERWVLAGIFLAVALLVKLTAIFGLFAILTILAIRVVAGWRADRRVRIADVRAAITVVAVSAGLFLAGLWALDARYSTYASPIDHIAHMVDYGAKLRSPVDRAGICATNDSAPWEWPFNECQITYLRVDVTTRVGEKVVSKVPSIDFRGALNPLLAGAIPLAFLFTGWLAWRGRHRLAGWAVIWAGANYLPYVVLSIVNHRITYIYYFLQVIPAIAIAVTILLLRSSLPRFVTVGFIVAYAVGFAAYFPFRTIP